MTAKEMNRRERMKFRAFSQRKNPPVMCIIRGDEPFWHVIFVDLYELDEAKEKYGDKLEIWGGKYE